MRTLEDIVAAMPVEQWDRLATRCDQIVIEERARQMRRKRRRQVVAPREPAQQPMLVR